jgi:hypothetical protein
MGNMNFSNHSDRSTTRVRGDFQKGELENIRLSDLEVAAEGKRQAEQEAARVEAMPEKLVSKSGKVYTRNGREISKNGKVIYTLAMYPRPETFDNELTDYLG